MKEKNATQEREFLDIVGEKGPKGVEDLVLVVGQNNVDEGNVVELEQEQGKGRDRLPPWKRRPTPLDDNIMKRAKSFLSLCKTVGSERVTSQECCQDKQVVMNVHMGVFDINGNLPENSSFSDKEVVDVPEINLESVQQDKLCQIEPEDDGEETDEDQVSGSSFNYDSSSSKSLEEQRAIYNLLINGGKLTSKSPKDTDLVQVISSTNNE